MYVTVVPNRGSPPAILLRETYREDGKVKNRTLANLSKWQPEKIAALRAGLRDERLPPGAARTRLLALALIVARLLDPAAKLATARQLDETTASHSLGAVLGLGAVAVNELYRP